MSTKAVVASSMARIRRMLRWVALVAGRRPAMAEPAEDLIDAACRGDAAAVQALLAKGADANAKGNDGGTALIMASEQGHLDVEALLANGADVNAKTTDGWTTLDAAGKADVRALLVRAGAKP